MISVLTIDLLLLNNRGLVSTALRSLGRSLSAAWVALQILDLTDMAILLHVSKDNAIRRISVWFVEMSASLCHSSLHESVLLNKEA